MRKAVVMVAVMALVGCYNARVETGATPSTQKVTKSFASSWIYGLVPPSTVETAARCPNGVATVETKISFVNGLVGFLTLAIYTPMTIEVTCAAARDGGDDAETLSIRAGASTEERQDAVAEAVRRSRELRAPVVVRFE